MNADTSLSLLFNAIMAQTTPALWVLDEHGADTPLPASNPHVSVLTNRYDVAREMSQKGWQTDFSDYDFDHLAVDTRLETIFFRIAKEKPVVHHVINAAALRLQVGGQLQLTGTKQQGIKTYAKHAAQRLGGTLELKKHGNDYLAIITRGQTIDTAPLDDKDYPDLRQVITLDDSVIYSKPGVYGWDKIDAGSALLAAHMDAFCPAQHPDSILDMGCGYGYLSIKAKHHFNPERIVATDNNAAAILACRKNFAAFNIQGEVVTDNCAAGINENFDLILCNPPFHQGFGVDRGLTENFIKTARRLCTRQGVAGFVVNTFIPIERIAQPHFGKIRTIVNDGHFKLVRMMR